MRRFLILLPVVLGLSGCIDSSVDLSATVAPAYPLVEGYYQATDDPKTPAFKVVRNGADYLAIDPEKTDGSGAAFALMDPDHTGAFIAEDKNSTNAAGPRRYVYYFVMISAARDRVELYDFTPKDWRRLPGDLRRRLVLGNALRLANNSETETVLRTLDRRLAAHPSIARTTFRLVRKLESGEN